MTRLPSIASLMSPPEATPHETFSPALKATELPRSLSPRCRLPPITTLSTSNSPAMPILPSPPTSPPNLLVKSNGVDMERGKQGARSRPPPPQPPLRDPILYPGGPVEAVIPASQPLFPSAPSIALTEEAANTAVSNYMSMHTATADQKVDQPTREEYLLALSFLSTLGRSYNRNPGAYMKRTREETEDQYWKAKRICAKPGDKAASIKIAPAPAPAPVPAKPPKKAIKAIKAAPAVPRVRRTPKPAPAVKVRSSPTKGRSATPDLRMPGTKRPEDTDFRALPNYAPPTSTLPAGNPKSLKADWPSPNVLNLANDPDRGLLHEAELNLAATLRLSCATYLCSKLRIFAARVYALRIGKEFRKTDAQQACKIDVNKASKLWTAYDRVGWFDPSYFKQYI